eukprot:TRINITY_DN19368_c0_g1_i3.p1 TRINITY_DN19368_c0_g1~~TRINITY_DN19368_c0_g1_i3.p1  ORF type:complete len:306 (+),score=74.64 TRINITY_DN19368_c0_g1_i3:45-962(+)
MFMRNLMTRMFFVQYFFFFFQAEDGIRDAQESRGLGDVYKRQAQDLGPVDAVRGLHARTAKQVMVELPDEQDVYALLRRVKREHANVIGDLAECCEGFTSWSQLQLQELLRLRVGIHTLMSHAVASQSQEPGRQGLVHTPLNVRRVLEVAVQDASHLCDRVYGEAPQVQLLGADKTKFEYFQEHVYFVVFELLKNAMRGTAEAHKATMSPIEIRVVQQDDWSIAFSISDTGVGMDLETLRNAQAFGFTTAAEISARDRSPMAGFGYGIPLSRIYCEYMGGGLEMVSQGSVGTTCVFEFHNETENF